MSDMVSARFSASLAMLLAFAPGQLAAGEKVVDKVRGFTLTLPDGFAPKPGLVGAKPDIIHAFVLDDHNDDKLDIMLLIEDMRGIIRRERLKPEDMPPGFQGRQFTTHWRGFELDAFAVPERLGDIATVTYNVQIPLKRGAIQVKLFGPVDREPELKRLLAEILEGLNGESNWIASALPASTITSSDTYGILLLIFAIVFVLGGLVASCSFQRKLRKERFWQLRQDFMALRWFWT
jgi:hypothetical protein